MLSLMAMMTLGGQAQPRPDLKEKIGVDCGMPDFNTTEVDGKVIGVRLAKMLNRLMKYASNYDYNSMLASVLNEQNPQMQYAIIKKARVRSVVKSGSDITIVIRLKLKENSYGVGSPDLVLRFVDGVSESSKTNSLFFNLNRYID